MVKCNDKLSLEETITQTEEHILKQTGYSIKLCEKSLLPTESDMIKLRPAFNNLSVKDDYFVSEDAT